MSSVPPLPQAYSPEADDEIDLRDLLGVIVDGRWLLLGVLGAVVLFGLSYGVFATRIYEADALVQVETEDRSIHAALGDMAELLGGEVEVTAEIEILKSRMVVGRVVDELALDVVVEPRYFPIIGYRYAHAFDGEEGDLAEPPLGLNSFAWGGEKLELGELLVPRPLLGQELRLEVQRQGYVLRDPEGHPLLSGVVGERARANTPYGPVEIFVRRLIALPGMSFGITRHPRINAITTVQEQIKVTERGKNSGILAVSLEGPNAARVTEVLNRLVTAYQVQNVERKSAEAAQTLEFLEQQLPKLKRELETAEGALNRYRLQRGSADLTKETELILQHSVELETARMALSQKREEALRRFTPDHPAVQTIDAQLADVRSELNKVEAQVKTLPETQQEVLRLARNVQVNTELYTALLNNAQELQVVKAGTVGNVRIIDYAVAPFKPAKPKVALVLALSLVLGSFLGLVAVFLRRALNAGVEDPAEVERSLGLPVYATIPYVREQRRLAEEIKQTGPGKERLLAALNPENIAVEALRSLRTSLHFALLEAPNKTIMLTGPAPSLGKSFVALNLGAVLAASGKRVVVVDLDLRRGRIHEYLGGQRQPGFTDYILGNSTAEQVLRKTSVDGLHVVSTGTLPPNPAELLMHERVTDFMQSLGKQYDYVIIDTPPILAVTDAALVGRLAGTTLMVLKAGDHPLRMIEDAARRLQNAGVMVKGVLFNQMGRSGTRTYGYKYGYAYAYEYKSAAK